jgi:ketosteroid isomerase-like protein
MRNRALLLLTAVALGVSACGGVGDSDEDQIRSVTDDFTEAVQDKDAGKLCDSVAIEKIPEGKKCEGELSDTFFKAVGKLEDVKVSEIKVKGDTATAKVAATVEGKEMKDDGSFKKVDGDWKLDLDE